VPENHENRKAPKSRTETRGKTDEENGTPHGKTERHQRTNHAQRAPKRKQNGQKTATTDGSPTDGKQMQTDERKQTRQAPRGTKTKVCYRKARKAFTKQAFFLVNWKLKRKPKKASNAPKRGKRTLKSPKRNTSFLKAIVFKQGSDVRQRKIVCFFAQRRENSQQNFQAYIGK
jgi:hypothetical protein